MATMTATGECFCGCGKETSPGAYFTQGHDKKAEGDLNAILHNDSVAERVVGLGYGPGGMNLHERAIVLGVRERCGIDGCNTSGVTGGPGMRQHRAKHHPAKL